MSVEVPCTQCGNAAVELTPPQLSAAVRLIAGKMAKMLGAGGGELDPDAPIIGMTAEQFAAAFGVRCIACVDAASENGGGMSCSSKGPAEGETPICEHIPPTPLPAGDIIDATYDAPTH